MPVFYAVYLDNLLFFNKEKKKKSLNVSLRMQVFYAVYLDNYDLWSKPLARESQFAAILMEMMTRSVRDRRKWTAWSTKVNRWSRSNRSPRCRNREEHLIDRRFTNRKGDPSCCSYTTLRFLVYDYIRRRFRYGRETLSPLRNCCRYITITLLFFILFLCNRS